MWDIDVNKKQVLPRTGFGSLVLTRKMLVVNVVSRLLLIVESSSSYHYSRREQIGGVAQSHLHPRLLTSLIPDHLQGNW